MSELETAIAFANRVLEHPYADPDRDTAVLSRQFLRALAQEKHVRATVKNIATQKTTEELKAEGEQEYDDADFEGAYDALIHIARRALQPL